MVLFNSQSWGERGHLTSATPWSDVDIWSHLCQCAYCGISLPVCNPQLLAGTWYLIPLPATIKVSLFRMSIVKFGGKSSIDTYQPPWSLAGIWIIMKTQLHCFCPDGTRLMCLDLGKGLGISCYRPRLIIPCCFNVPWFIKINHWPCFSISNIFNVSS